MDTKALKIMAEMINQERHATTLVASAAQTLYMLSEIERLNAVVENRHAVVGGLLNSAAAQEAAAQAAEQAGLDEWQRATIECLRTWCDDPGQSSLTIADGDKRGVRALLAAPASVPQRAVPQGSPHGYRLEWKPGDYIFTSPSNFAKTICKEGARIWALYSKPQSGCDAKISVHKGRYWVEPKNVHGDDLSDFTPLYLGPVIYEPDMPYKYPFSEVERICAALLATPAEQSTDKPAEGKS